MSSKWELLDAVLAVDLPVELLYKIVAMSSIIVTDEESDVAHLAGLLKSIKLFKDKKEVHNS